MPYSVSPKDLMQEVNRGRDRIESYRKARLMMLEKYVGPHYNKSEGVVGEEPMNLMFDTVQILIPNLVMKNPEHVVTADYLHYQFYADLLSEALNRLAIDVNYKTQIRRAIFDAIFGLGIIKTGLTTAGKVVEIGGEAYDVGQPFMSRVDLDDFLIDSRCKSIEESLFIGHKIRISREMALDSGLYNNELLERVNRPQTFDNEKVESLSKDDTPEAYTLGDFIDVYELYIPDANVILTVPADRSTFDDYLRISEYYGSEEGPYTFLSLSGDVPNNPLPVPPASIWLDLSHMVTKMARKACQQSIRQKDILAYTGPAAEDAQAIMDATDGDVVQIDNPKAVQEFSIGGANPETTNAWDMFYQYLNRMAGNAEYLGGINPNSGTATEAEIMQANAGVRLEDLRDTVYDAATKVSRKLAWYLHTDPLLDIPLTRREVKEPKPGALTDGNIVFSGPDEEIQEVRLTPELRCGDFLDYNFQIKFRSMNRLSEQVKSRRLQEFAAQVIPGMANATMMCAQMGVPFNFQRAVTLVGEKMGLEGSEISAIFIDPMFEAKQLQMLQMGPGPEGTQGQVAPAASTAGFMQNRQAPTARPVAGPATERRQSQQEVANDRQGSLEVRQGA